MELGCCPTMTYFRSTSARWSAERSERERNSAGRPNTRNRKRSETAPDWNRAKLYGTIILWWTTIWMIGVTRNRPAHPVAWPASNGRRMRWPKHRKQSQRVAESCGSLWPKKNWEKFSARRRPITRKFSPVAKGWPPCAWKRSDRRPCNRRRIWRKLCGARNGWLEKCKAIGNDTIASNGKQNGAWKRRRKNSGRWVVV